MCGPRMLSPLPSRATKPRPERFAISSICWRRPWMHGKCSRPNVSRSLPASYAISRRSYARIEASPHRTSSRSATSNVNWRRTSGVGVSTPTHARCSMDILELLEGRRRAAADPDVDEAYARTLLELGSGDLEQEHFDATLVWVQRAEEALKSLVQDPRRLEAIVMIDRARQTIAALLGRRGLEEQRRKLLETHLRMLEHLSDSGGGDPAIGLLAALTRAELAADDSAIATLRAAIQRFPANRRLPEWFEARVGDWIASDVKPYASGPNPTGEPKGRLDPDAHADLVIRALESRCEALGVDHSLLPPWPSRWLTSPPVGTRSSERLASSTMPAGPPRVSPPSRRDWHEEIPTRRHSTCYCPKPSSRNRKTPEKSRITPRSKRRFGRHRARPAPR